MYNFIHSLYHFFLQVKKVVEDSCMKINKIKKKEKAKYTIKCTSENNSVFKQQFLNPITQNSICQSF